MNLFTHRVIGLGLNIAFLLSIYAPSSLFGEEMAFKNAYINYQELTHAIVLTQIRAGNHDESGNNKYYFKASIYALRINKEDRKATFAERQKIEKSLGMFGAVTLKSLSALSPMSKDNELTIDGDVIRELISQAMRKFQLREDQVAIKVDIVMMLKSKKHYVLNDDKTIGSVSYYPIPETLPHGVDKNDHALAITDDFGADVGIAIKFAVNAKKTETEGEPTPPPPSPTPPPR